jgi:hypothetical protein
MGVAKKILFGCAILNAMMVLVAEHVTVTGNLHQTGQRDCLQSCSMMAVSPTDIIYEQPSATQVDTFRGMGKKKYMGVPVPVYHFKQPGRLSNLGAHFSAPFHSTSKDTRFVHTGFQAFTGFARTLAPANTDVCIHNTYPLGQLASSGQLGSFRSRARPQSFPSASSWSGA